MRKRRTSPSKKKKPGALSASNVWFEHPGIFYKKGAYTPSPQSFSTFIRKAGYTETKFILDGIKAMVPNPEKKAALEIGPGLEPVISRIGFARNVFLDVSREIAQEIKKSEKNAEIILGNIRKIPLKVKTRFGIAVINETMTHVPPRERIRVTREIAGLTDSVMIVERKWKSVRQIMNEQKINAKKARDFQRMLVNFEPIKRFLERNNWKLKITNIKLGKHSYTILTAKRK